jgi:predicted 3-demethylubiquinone-9 3-methyltransferase (glyoxalase superfamily)
MANVLKISPFLMFNGPVDEAAKGVSWQSIPDALGRYLGDPNREKTNRALQAMLKMKKIIVADLDKAYAG